MFELIHILVETHFLDDRGDQPLGILGIVNGKIAGVAQFVPVVAKQARKYGMEGTHPEIFCLRTSHQVCNPFFHFPGSLVGKGKRKDVKGIHSLFHQVGDPVGEHPGFTGTGACYYHKRAILV